MTVPVPVPGNTGNSREFPDTDLRGHARTCAGDGLDPMWRGVGGLSGSKRALSGSGAETGPLRIRGGQRVLTGSVCTARSSQDPPPQMGTHNIHLPTWVLTHHPKRASQRSIERACRHPNSKKGRRKIPSKTWVPLRSPHLSRPNLNFLSQTLLSFIYQMKPSQRLFLRACAYARAKCCHTVPAPHIRPGASALAGVDG